MNAYKIRIKQAAPLCEYGWENNHVNIGYYFRPRKEVEKYASTIRKLLGDVVTVEVIKEEMKLE